MDLADDSADLQLFRRKWKNELRKKLKNAETRSQCYRDNLENYQHTSKRNFQGVFRCFGEEVRQFDADLGDQVDPLEFLSEKFGNTGESNEFPDEKSTEIVLLSLPQPSRISEQSTSLSDYKIQGVETNCTENREKSLVDQLIEDIDEITSIPFFDLSLPREVGIQIFSHLEFKDLCACAQVSKSWKLLAEDELIWYHVGCRLGYVQRRNCTALNGENWKTIVQHSMLEERGLRRNWKERICRVSSLEFERGETPIIHSGNTFLKLLCSSVAIKLNLL